jgi:hypothetical protein
MRKRGIIVVAAVLGMSLVMAGCKSTPSLGVREPVTIMAQFQGNDPGLKDADVFVVNSKAELEERKCQDLLKHDVDFDKCSLVVWAVGEQKTGGFWANITGVQHVSDNVYVQATLNAPAKDQVTAQMVTYPYCAAVVAKLPMVKIVYHEPESVEGQPMPSPSMPAPGAPAMH